MASFEDALLLVLQNEGGYAINSHDSGGETYRGVSRRNWPSWTGWSAVDQLRSHPDFPRCLDADSALQTAVTEFYRQQFWRFDLIQSQEVANKLFDMCVNLGIVKTVTLLQKSLVRSGLTLAVDGQLGDKTLAQANAATASTLLHALRFYSVCHYVEMVRADPVNQEFLNGWLDRAVG
jgi:lysozyme family protein